MHRINLAFDSHLENFSDFNLIRCDITSTYELGLNIFGDIMFLTQHNKLNTGFRSCLRHMFEGIIQFHLTYIRFEL